MKNFLPIFAAVLFCLFAGAVETKAQLSCTAVAYGASWVFQDGNKVHGYSATELNGCAGAYYDPATWGRFSEGNWATETPILLGEAYTEGYGAFIDARIDYRYIYPANNEYYNVDTTHYVIEYFQQGGYWYDPFGFGFLPGAGGPTFPGTGSVGLWVQRRRRLGSTYHTIRYQGQTQCGVGAQFTPTGKPCIVIPPTPTPTPAPTITAKIKDKNGNDITATEKNVMIGVPTKLTAESNSSQASYSWSLQGASTNSTSAASILASWSTVGTYTISLTATQGQSTVTVQTTVKVKLPVLNSITATEIAPKIYAVGACANPDDPSILLGCERRINGQATHGILTTAEAIAPTGDISNQGEAKLQFVQLANPFRSEKRLPENKLYCKTERTTPDDLSTGWKLDGTDPYDANEAGTIGSIGGVPTTATFSAGVAKARVNDIPEEGLRQTSEEFVDDKFELYAVYSVRPVQGEIIRRIIGKLPWDWKAKATKSPTGQWSLDPAVTTPSTTRTITGTAVTQETANLSDIRPYSGVVDDVPYKYCGPQEQLLLDAKFVTMTLKSDMKVGEVFEASITMTNTGTKTWTKNDFSLDKISPSSPEIKPSFIDVSRDVATNQTVTINFTIKAPDEPGSYKVSWRMYDYTGNLAIGFGESTPLKTIQVRADSNPPPTTSGEPSDLAVWRRNTGVWYLINGSTGTFSDMTWGISSDIATPGDYDGDGKTDFSIFRPSTGQWYVLNSSDSTWYVPTWGQTGDVPSPADYDGDGKTDVSVVRETNGIFMWYIIGSSNSVQFSREFGVTGDKPSPADYDGDGEADIAVWRSGNQTFYSLPSQTNSFNVLEFGYPGSEAVSADYDGDGKADFAVKDGNNWHILYSYYGYVMSDVWKLETDIPVPNDYDGDGKVDIAVWRESTGEWYIRNSSDLSTRAVSWGEPGDIPVPAYYRR